MLQRHVTRTHHPNNKNLFRSVGVEGLNLGPHRSRDTSSLFKVRHHKCCRFGSLQRVLLLVIRYGTFRR